MRRFLVLVLTLVAGSCVLGVPSAAAGGPTSVLVTNYGSGRSAAALTGSPAYSELQSVLGEGSAPAGTASPPAQVATSEVSVRLVWLIHDISPWRIDTVHVVDGDVWVETFVDVTGEDPFARTPTWSQPARADDLVATLTGLGVLGTSPAGSGGPTSGPAAVPPPTVAAAAAADTVSRAPASGPPWLLAAALVLGAGVAGTLAGTMLTRRGVRLPPLPRATEASG
ncbi:hypothetical protein G7075_18320 [Phycicoccus sp. HDW14]|uniref:hypothetical protein n=1 Tax=Phycicoccus sp. HDW14 TaxID=2714941 RepID=UPI00140AF7D9|nr:hypothetical protein [Phycicoccus sp. HDW14]QIM22636.1 hypothetical protein G7075_18320 [Phycicoccus sp. HDW14]